MYSSNTQDCDHDIHKYQGDRETVPFVWGSGAIDHTGLLELMDENIYRNQHEPIGQDWHSTHGIYKEGYCEKELRFQRESFPYTTMTPGDPVPDMRQEAEYCPVVDLWKLAGYLAELINSDQWWQVDTFIIYTDNRVVEDLVGKPGLAQHCVHREMQRAKLLLQERHGLLYTQPTEANGMQRLNPIYTGAEVLAGLRAQPFLNYQNFVVSDHDIFPHAAVDICQQTEYIAEVLRAEFGKPDIQLDQVGIFWASEERLISNAGRVVSPAPGRARPMSKHAVTQKEVYQNMMSARKEMWQTRPKLDELFQHTIEALGADVARDVFSTRLSQMRGLGKSALRDLAPDTPSKLTTLWATICEIMSEKCFPFLGGWQYRHVLKKVNLRWMWRARHCITSRMVGWGKAPSEQAILRTVATLASPKCLAVIVPGPSIFMGLTQSAQEAGQSIGPLVSHAYGSDELGRDTKDLAMQHNIEAPFPVWEQVKCGNGQLPPVVGLPSSKLCCNLRSTRMPRFPLPPPAPLPRTQIVAPILIGFGKVEFPTVKEPTLLQNAQVPPSDPHAEYNLDIFCHGLSVEEVGDRAAIEHYNAYNGGIIYAFTGEPSTDTNSQTTSNDHVLQGLQTLYHEPAFHEAVWREAAKVGVYDAHSVNHLMDWPRMSIPPYLYYGHTEAIIGIYALCDYLCKARVKVTIRGFSAGASVALGMERMITHISHQYPQTIVGGWCGPCVQLRPSPTVDAEPKTRQLTVVWSYTDQLSPLPIQWIQEDRLQKFCHKQHIRPVAINDAFDFFGMLGKKGHSFGHVVLQDRITRMPPKCNVQDLRNGGISLRADDSICFMLLVAAMLIYYDKKVIDITDLLPLDSDDDLSPILPWHVYEESAIGCNNYSTLTKIVHKCYRRLSWVKRTLFIERIGPEISREVFRLGDVLLWQAKRVSMLYEDHLNMTMQYAPVGPQSMYFRFCWAQKLRWAQFNYAPNRPGGALKRDADGFFEGMWAKVIFRVPPLEELNTLREHIQRAGTTEQGLLQEDGKGNTCLVIEGIVTVSFTHDKVADETGSIIHNDKAAVKLMELVSFARTPLYGTGLHELLCGITAQAKLEMVDLQCTEDKLGKCWWVNLKNLPEERAHVLNGSELTLCTSENATRASRDTYIQHLEVQGSEGGAQNEPEQPIKKQAKGGHFKYGIVDPAPAPPMPVREFRLTRAVELFYDIVVAGAEMQCAPLDFVQVVSPYLDMTQVGTVFTYLTSPMPSPLGLSQYIHAPAVMEIVTHWYYTLKLGKPVSFVTGIGGAAKSSSLALTLMMFLTWANHSILSHQPARVMVLGPRIASLQGWINIFDNVE